MVNTGTNKMDKICRIKTKGSLVRDVILPFLFIL
jgi:hypothetical protein